MAALLTPLAGLASVAAPAHAAQAPYQPTHIGIFPSASSGVASVSSSWDLDLGPNGDLYALEGNVVRQYTPTGELVRTIGAGVLGTIYGLSVDRDGVVYVAGYGKVWRFAPDGSLASSYDSPSERFADVAPGSDGSMYVVTYGGNQVRKVDSANHEVARWSGPISSTYGVAVDRDGFVWVPDYNSGRLHKFTSEGVLVSSTSAAGDRSLASPLRADTNAAGDVAVAEWGAAGFTLYAADGSVKASTQSRTPGFNNAFGVALDDSGRLFLSDVNSQAGIQRYELGPVFADFTPEISGSGRVGDELTVSATTTPDPASWTYAWTVSGSDEVRSTSASFTPAAADKGKTATVTVTAKGTDGKPADRTATATKAVTGRLLDATAFSISDSTASSAPTTGDVLTLDVDESKLPEDATGTVRWGHVAEGGCTVPEDAANTTTYPVVDADAGTTICARVAYTADGHEDLAIDVVAESDAVGTFVAPTPTVDVESPVVNGTVTASVDLEDAPRGADVTGWQWGVRDGEDCVAIEGASERTFTPDVSEFERTLCVTVTVGAPHRLDATGTATAGSVGAGAFTQSPTVTINGWTMVDRPAEVTVTGGDPADADRAYQWNLDGEPVDGATSSTYTPKASAVGKNLSVTVTSSSRGYVADVTTSAEVEVEEGDLAVAPPELSTDRPAVGSPVSLPLLLDDAPEGAAGHWQWGTLDDADECVAIDGATTDTFTPTAAELGDVLCAEVGVTAAGYGSLGGTFIAPHEVVRGTLPAIRAVLNSATPKVGSTLLASTLSGPLPESATTSVVWGQAVAGSQCRPVTAAASYPVTKDTVGRTVCALVTVGAPGYAEFSTVLRTSVITEAAKAAPSRKVVRGTDRFVVRAQGLAPGQRYRISIRHRTFTGHADSHGRVERTVRYGKGLRSVRRTIIVRGFDGTKVTYLERFTVTYRAR